jgi:hypothetical protein
MSVQDTFDGGMEHALAIVNRELDAVNSELDLSRKPTSMFKGTTKDQARQRFDTLTKFKRLLTSAKNGGYPP